MLEMKCLIAIQINKIRTPTSIYKSNNMYQYK